MTRTGAGSHDHHDPVRIGGTLVVDEPVAAARRIGELVEHVLVQPVRLCVHKGFHERATIGLIQVYLDGEFILEHSDELPFDVIKMTFYACCEGPALDNVVVRDQVMGVKPSE